MNAFSLLIGDSVDRFITEDWCTFRSLGVKSDKYNTYDTMWADGTLRYGGGKGILIPSLECVSEDKTVNITDRVSFVHTFGSSSYGPYFKHLSDSGGDPYVSTVKRIDRALDLYYTQVGVPDRIIYHSLQWDIQGIYERKGKAFMAGDSTWNETIKTLEINLNERVDQLLDRVANYSKFYNNKPTDIGNILYCTRLRYF